VIELQMKSSASGFASRAVREPSAEGVRSCYACGTCTAGCPVRRVNPAYNPRKLIRMVLLGMRDEILTGKAIWLCSSCYTCQERCPQGIRITDTIIALRNLAVREGTSPSGISMQAGLIKEQGRLYALDEFDDKKRKKAGLPSLPSEVEGAKKLLEQRK
jgi:heterodisulfide reductase subunit C